MSRQHELDFVGKKRSGEKEKQTEKNLFFFPACLPKPAARDALSDPQHVLLLERKEVADTFPVNRLFLR